MLFQEDPWNGLLWKDLFWIFTIQDIIQLDSDENYKASYRIQEGIATHRLEYYLESKPKIESLEYVAERVYLKSFVLQANRKILKRNQARSFCGEFKGFLSQQ